MGWSMWARRRSIVEEPPMGVVGCTVVLLGPIEEDVVAKPNVGKPEEGQGSDVGGMDMVSGDGWIGFEVVIGYVVEWRCGRLEYM